MNECRNSVAVINQCTYSIAVFNSECPLAMPSLYLWSRGLVLSKPAASIRLNRKSLVVGREGRLTDTCSPCFVLTTT
jgi:hypothetical protein